MSNCPYHIPLRRKRDENNQLAVTCFPIKKWYICKGATKFPTQGDGLISSSSSFCLVPPFSDSFPYYLFQNLTYKFFYFWFNKTNEKLSKMCMFYIKKFIIYHHIQERMWY